MQSPKTTPALPAMPKHAPSGFPTPASGAFDPDEDELKHDQRWRPMIPYAPGYEKRFSIPPMAFRETADAPRGSKNGLSPKLCRQYALTGACSSGPLCKFAHEPTTLPIASDERTGRGDPPLYCSECVLGICRGKNNQFKFGHPKDSRRNMQYTPSGSEQARTLETFRPFDNPEICSPPPAPQPELPCLPDWNTEEFFLAHGSGATRDGEEYDLPNNFSSSKVALSFEPDRRAVGTRNPVGEGGARGRSSTSSFLQGSPSSAGFKTKTVGLRDVQPQSAVV
ncbi:hypothetical protein BC827DRAFT_410189 [Russula dissimulans]|nr:hypothetical protein BC827DRAFT_410189 [Russula dissimulans]